MQAVNTPEDIQAMESSLIQVMGMFKHGMTEFEAKLWANLMDVTPRGRFENFLKAYILSPQARYGAPKPNDAAAALGLTLDAEAAYNQLEAAVRQYGPYQIPASIKDPVMVQAINNLGGWVRVNEMMPSPENSFEVKSFKERFSGALTQAVNQVRIENQQVQPLAAIGMSAQARPDAAIEGGRFDRLARPGATGV
mgnify:CR=1 FL=1